MEVLFIRHGHGEHLINYPSKLNTLHPGLTEFGKSQVSQLSHKLDIFSEDLVLVSPTKRTIETAYILTGHFNFTVTPLVGPRMFPQNPEFSSFLCDEIYSRKEILDLYEEVTLLDIDLDCWGDGINRMEQGIFEKYVQKLIDWIGDRFKRILIIAHDGTITNYRIFFGETGLTRKDFLGEAGIHKIKL